MKAWQMHIGHRKRASEYLMSNLFHFVMIKAASLRSHAIFCGAVIASTSLTSANGLYENRPWQFESPLEKSAKAGVVDIIERKKGGFYDGFTTVVYNTTNIGSQINCTNTASTNANIADNQQGGASLSSAPQNSASADAIGSSTASQQDSLGSGMSSDVVNNDQNNSGAINSTLHGASVSSSLRNIDVAGTDQNLGNSQSNSGSLSSSLNDSTACTMGGATLNGSVESNVDSISRD
jgi:hypothetical protein